VDRGRDLFTFGLKPDDTASIEAIEAGVKGFEDKYSYIWINHNQFESHLKDNLGCESVKCGLLEKGGLKYRMQDNGASLNAADIKKFLEDDRDGNLKIFSKSAEIPAEKEEDNVTVLVNKNFESEVKGKNVFVFYYAPWCGHCKSSKPEYEKLKLELARDDIVIAKFDATTNDISHPNVEVKGYPKF